MKPGHRFLRSEWLSDAGANQEEPGAECAKRARFCRGICAHAIFFQKTIAPVLNFDNVIPTFFASSTGSG